MFVFLEFDGELVMWVVFKIFTGLVCLLGGGVMVFFYWVKLCERKEVFLVSDLYYF